MFKKIGALSCVESGYSVFDRRVYYSNKSNLLIYSLDDRNCLKEVINRYDVEFFQVSENGIYLILDDSVLILGKELQEIRRCDIGVVSKVFDNGKTITDEGYNVKNFLCQFGLFDLQTNRLLWTSHEFRSFGSENGQDIYLMNFDSIQKVNDSDGRTVWEFNFDVSLAERSPFLIGQINDLALFGLQDQDKLIALSSVSGELVWEVATIPQMSQLYEGKLYSLTGGYVCRDALTGEDVARYRDEKYTEEIGIVGQRNNFVFVGNHIITTDHLKGRIGAFNIKTFKYDWIHEVPGVYFPSPKPIIYEEPYLLLQDNMDTLHIFKKE